MVQSLVMLPVLIAINSVEFYVIAAVIAAAVVAFSARKSDEGPVRQILLPGVLAKSDTAPSAMVELLCNDDGSVILRRHGVTGVSVTGAVSLAITIKGFDVKIKERVVEGSPADEEIDMASFILDFMAEERYFISYTSDKYGLFAALTLKNRPGNRVVKSLQ